MIKFHEDFVILDLEINPPSGAIIEIGATRLLRTGQVHPVTFETLINPNEKLGYCRGDKLHISTLTGITQEMVDYAPAFPEAMMRFEAWAFRESKNLYLASWGIGDVPALRAAYRTFGRNYPFRGASFDIKSMVTFYTALTRRKYQRNSLRGMMKAWNIEFQGRQHRALPDAANTTELLCQVIKHHNKAQDAGMEVLKYIGFPYKD